MRHIIDGVLRFQREVHPQSEALFQKLSRGQSPSAMFIGCADSRIVPEVLTQQGPGELFVVRNAGNVVPPDSPIPNGVTASVEYAVAVLGIPDIVICGHSGCGAMTAILDSGKHLEQLPAVARWLHYADAARDMVLAEYAESTPEERLTALIQENVLCQLNNLTTYPAVAEALEKKRLRLHGWVYDIGQGCVSAYDAQAQEFVPIGENPLAHATPA